MGSVSKSPKETFNNDPALYDQIRPAYPEPLVEDIVNVLQTRRHVENIGRGLRNRAGFTAFYRKGFDLTYRFRRRYDRLCSDQIPRTAER